MKVIVAGGRDFNDEEFMAEKLREVYESGVVTSEPELVCGMAKGADSVAKDIFIKEGLKVHERPANWQDMSEPCVVGTNYFGKYNKLAGMKRNHAMGDEAEILIAYHDGRSKGTADMIKYMKSLGKTVYVFNY